MSDLARKRGELGDAAPRGVLGLHWKCPLHRPLIERMSPLERTFELLRRSACDSAVESLCIAARSSDVRSRLLATQSLADCEHPAAAEWLVENWDNLDASQRTRALSKPDRLRDAISHYFDSTGVTVPDNATKNNRSTVEASYAAPRNRIRTTRMIRVAGELNRETNASTPALVNALLRLIEGCAEDVRESAEAVLIAVCRPIGRSARRSDSSISLSLRTEVLERLTESLKRFERHRSHGVVDAFLHTATWTDSALQNALAHRQLSGPMLERLSGSPSDDVADLLAGFISRPRFEPAIARLIEFTQNDTFGSRLLGAITDRPDAMTLRNMGELQYPQSLPLPTSDYEFESVAQRIAMIHLISASRIDPVTRIRDLLKLFRDRGDVARAMGAALGRIEPPSTDWFIAAAVGRVIENEASSDGPTEGLNFQTEDRQRLDQLIEFLQHGEPSLVRGAVRVLTPVHAGVVMNRFENLGEQERALVARVVTTVDPAAAETIAHRLRHPVLARRLEAIAAAESLGFVETLAKSFVRLSTEDHQQARIRAAEAMAQGDDETTRGLLMDMLALPESQVRDAAEASLRTRNARGKTSGMGESSADEHSFETVRTRGPF